MNDSEKNTVHELIGRHGPERVRAGIDAAINAGGRSVNYVSKCVETVPSASGRYDPTYDIAEIEALLDAEWHEEEEDT